MRYDAVMKKSPSETGRENAVSQLLGGISFKQFLTEYWQKKPLLVRQAIPGFEGLLSPEELAGLACEEDVQSRLILWQKGKWSVEHGPIEETRFSKLPERDWTLLVQEVNHHLEEASDLLQAFDFIPYARLDDLMVSYAPDGGGVGPHFDSYDVFLLQGQGKRKWRISQQTDLGLVEDAPLRILQHFDTEAEYVLEAGDMLYLPPQVAHWGIAVGDCMTYSIGFRAPAVQELVTQFLTHLQEKIDLPGLYQDPDLTVQTHPAEVGKAMTTRVAAMLQKLTWDERDIGSFLAQYLSEPKPHVLFHPPRPMTLQAFHKKLRGAGIVLDGKSQMLFHRDLMFMNGEPVEAVGTDSDVLIELADHRRLPPGEYSAMALVERLHGWYLAGYVRFGG